MAKPGNNSVAVTPAKMLGMPTRNNVTSWTLSFSASLKISAYGAAILAAAVCEMVAARRSHMEIDLFSSLLEESNGFDEMDLVFVGVTVDVGLERTRE